jgi:hypothetical protein
VRAIKAKLKWEKEVGHTATNEPPKQKFSRFSFFGGKKK